MREEYTPIDCISVIASDGKITPLRFRLELRDRERLRVNVDQILDTRHIPYVGAEAQVFLCRGNVEGRDQVFELKYTIRSHCWFLVHHFGREIR